MLEGKDRRDSIGVQMDCSSRAVLRLRQFDCPAVEMHLRPGAGVLFGEPHAGVDAHDQLRLMFWEAPGDDRRAACAW